MSFYHSPFIANEFVESIEESLDVGKQFEKDVDQWDQVNQDIPDSGGDDDAED